MGLPPLFLFPTVKMPFCVRIPCQPSAHTAFWRHSRTALGGGRSFHPSSWGFLTCGPEIQSWGGPGAEMGEKGKSIFIFPNLQLKLGISLSSEWRQQSPAEFIVHEAVTQKSQGFHPHCWCCRHLKTAVTNPLSPGVSGTC